jgi:hypothetical protein
MIYRSIYLSVCLSVCLSVRLSIYLSIYLAIYGSAVLFWGFFRFFSILILYTVGRTPWTRGSARRKAAIYLSIYLSVCLSIYLSIYGSAVLFWDFSTFSVS